MRCRGLFSVEDWGGVVGFGISSKLSPLETICVRCRGLFPVEDWGGVVDLSSAELAERVVKVNWCEGSFPFYKHKR